MPGGRALQAAIEKRGNLSLDDLLQVARILQQHGFGELHVVFHSGRIECIRASPTIRRPEELNILRRPVQREPAEAK